MAAGVTSTHRRCRVEVDGREVELSAGTSLLAAALGAEVYIPHLCHHPGLAPPRPTEAEAVYRGNARVESTIDREDRELHGCGLCVVEVAGATEPLRACELAVTDGLVARTDSPRLRAARRERLAAILARHPHACLTCAQREGCSREPCSSNVPVAERCCELLGRCELEKVAEHVGIPPETPRYVPGGWPAATADPLITWRPELCVACLRCVRACGELRGVGAMSYVMTEEGPVVGLVAATRAEAGCRYCGACVEVCPTGSLVDSAAVGAEPVPCRGRCPAEMDVPRFLRAVSRGEIGEAALVALDRLPLPGVLGRVCFHPCEAGCRRSGLGGALSVCRVRRAVFEAVEDGPPPWPQGADTGCRVAVVGAGPAGLSAAHFLGRLGHRVTVLEGAPEAGGMLRSGIPAYRLPGGVLRRDLGRLLGQGIELRTGVALGAGLTLGDLRGEGYDAIVVAAGATAPRRLGVKGETLAGVMHGVPFLRETATGGLAAGCLAGRRVLVIGGGNVAVDAARTAVRMEAGSVTLACLEDLEEMPAYPPEVAAALAEGVRILTGWGPTELLGVGDVVRGARLVRCLSVFDAGGRFAPRLDHDTSREHEADVVIVAIGQQVGEQLRNGMADSLPSTGGGFLGVGPDGVATAVPGVFACGDVSLGPSSVVRAVADGRRAAEAVDRFLGGSGEIPSILPAEEPSPWIGSAETFADRSRVIAREAAPEKRVRGFGEVEATLSAAAARGEAQRCLQCDLRWFLSSPTFPPVRWWMLDERTVEAVPEEAGVYQLLGEDRVAVRIVGTPDLRAALHGELAGGGGPWHFVYEEEPMYTKRESELIQKFLAVHGRMPGGADELDDLF